MPKVSSCYQWGCIDTLLCDKAAFSYVQIKDQAVTQYSHSIYLSKGSQSWLHAGSTSEAFENIQASAPKPWDSKGRVWGGACTFPWSPPRGSKGLSELRADPELAEVRPAGAQPGQCPLGSLPSRVGKEPLGRGQGREDLYKDGDLLETPFLSSCPRFFSVLDPWTCVHLHLVLHVLANNAARLLFTQYFSAGLPQPSAFAWHTVCLGLNVFLWP